MPIRNPFSRRPSAVTVVVPDEDPRPSPGFERVDTVGSKASSVLSIRSARSHDTGEYKMSVVSDSGVYLPPSPPDQRAQWPRRYLSSRNSSDTRSSSDEFQQFSMSRESFDSYRRSFDISARSPVAGQASPSRQSSDSPGAYRPAPTRPSTADFPPADDDFEEIGLDDHKQPRRRGFFSKFGEPLDGAASSRFLLPGRKRGQSGQGAELGNIRQSSVSEGGN
ncbi:hypothetical protein GQ602_000266 [Ophiocordyceps camponoti-floridani]|uniref:Uncharacterized protein n=1 Tax=Ophiocordyceps camponoti-floridani TaxID=2030778 RepID=A0A8H4QC45_9HYPO|nr:hypothetical protein GQ602_000266 [Ophiocordyceps camponoti-floridani]